MLCFQSLEFKKNEFKLERDTKRFRMIKVVEQTCFVSRDLSKQDQEKYLIVFYSYTSSCSHQRKMSFLSKKIELAEEQMDVINKSQQRSLRKEPKNPTSELRQWPTSKSGRGRRARKRIHFNTDLGRFVTRSLRRGFLCDSAPSKGSQTCRARPFAAAVSCWAALVKLQNNTTMSISNKLLVVSERGKCGSYSSKSPAALCL